MIVCSKCGKSIIEESAFCPHCGVALEKTESKSFDDTEFDNGEVGVEKKHISKKKTIIRIVIVFVIVLLGIVLICEAKIAKAKQLYAQNEYMKAYDEVKYIPNLGREDLIRMKIAWFAGGYYESYLKIKRNRLSSMSDNSEDAYREAFFDLMFGLTGDLSVINREQDHFNDTQLDEFQKFANLSYLELESMFHMSKLEADQLVEIFNELETVDEEKFIANEWLDEAFFLIRH
ncbi:MAG: zinc ribbon domain-containing protein [Eubacterium sp.]|nr:zinc ribbon domain-containing protein [Eubacterium sp.]